MVHMHGPQLKRMLIAQCHEGVQQDCRIESARECQHQPRLRRDVASETLRHGSDDWPIWQGFP